MKCADIRAVDQDRLARHGDHDGKIVAAVFDVGEGAKLLLDPGGGLDVARRTNYPRGRVGKLSEVLLKSTQLHIAADERRGANDGDEGEESR